MSERSAIEWTATQNADGSVTPGATWNPVLGCAKVSEGCRGCYAVPQAWMKQSNPSATVREAYSGLVEKRPDGSLNWTGRVNLVPERLALPLTWKKPKRVFVNSLSDLFHELVPDEFIDRVFAVMALAQHHTFQVLTKRPERMAAYVAGLPERGVPVMVRVGADGRGPLLYLERVAAHEDVAWPLPNVWLGTSTEDQRTADERIPHLLNTPAAVRWLSCEPLLGAIDLSEWIGGTNGRGAESGRGHLSSRDGWAVRDRHARAHLEGGGQAGQPLERGHNHNILPAPPSRTSDGPRLPPGSGDAVRTAGLRDGSQTGLAALSGADSRRHDDQPHRRGEGSERSGEPGVGDVFGTADSCTAHLGARSDQPVRRTERDGKADDRAGSGDSAASGEWRVAESDCGGLRGVRPYGLEDRTGEPLGSLISWVICGGESGPKARPMDLDWARGLRDQCVAAGVAFHFKQVGGRTPKAGGRELDGRTWDEFPNAAVPA